MKQNIQIGQNGGGGGGVTQQLIYVRVKYREGGIYVI